MRSFCALRCACSLLVACGASGCSLSGLDGGHGRGAVVTNVRLANGWIAVDRCRLYVHRAESRLGHCWTENTYLGPAAAQAMLTRVPADATGPSSEARPLAPATSPPPLTGGM